MFKFNPITGKLDLVSNLVETDPIYSASTWFTTTNNATDWDTAYSWGDHAGLYDAAGTASGLIGTHESTYDHTLIATALQTETDPLSLHLDQTTPQSVVNGSPIMEGVQFDTTPTTSNVAEGLLRWNDTDGTLDLGMSGGDITMQIGQEMFIKVRNNSGVTIPNGSPVYFSGSLGNRPIIDLARSDSLSTCVVEGITTQDIEHNTDGYITTIGYVRQIKTNYSGTGDWGTTWVIGDKLYVSKTVAGQLTNVEPDEPHCSDIVGTVGVVGALGTGSILVGIQRHTLLSQLSDVDGTALSTDGQILIWHNPEGYFDFDDNINNYLRLDQTTPQTILNDIPLLEETRVIDEQHQLVDKYYVDQVVTSIGARYYMYDTASGTEDYKLTQSTPSADIEASDAHASVIDNEYLRGWISPVAGMPRKLIIGVYDWVVYAQQTGGTGKKDLRLYWELVERKADTSEVVIATSSNTNLIGTTKAKYSIFLTLSSDYEIASDSYIVGKIYADVSGSGADPSVTLFYEGDSLSHWEIPTSTEVLSDTFVPYTGATANVDLGTYNLTTTSTVSGGTLTDGVFSVTAGAITGASGSNSQWTNDEGFITGITGESIGDLSDVNDTGKATDKVLKYNAVSGDWEVGDDNNTEYTAGTGLSLVGTEFSNSDTGSNAVSTHESTYVHTDIALNTSSRHDAVTVTDSLEIDFTLTGQDITASLIAGSIDETKLDVSTNASLDLADSALQNIESESVGDLSDVTLTAGQTLTITSSTTLSGGTHSGTNTGDQTAISDFTGTKAEFDTACTDGSFAFSGGAFHDGFSDFVANEHIDWTVSQTPTVIHADNYTNTTYVSGDFDHNSLTNTHNLTTDIDHDSLTNFDANEHFIQTSISNLDSTLATGLVKITTGTGALSSITDNSTNWDTAYGWGNHASAGYLTSLTGAYLTNQTVSPQTILGAILNEKTGGGIGFSGNITSGAATDAFGINIDVLASAATDESDGVGAYFKSNAVRDGKNAAIILSASNSTVNNYSLYVENGDVWSEVAMDWDLVDNNASALSFDAAGKAGILEIVTTNDAEGVKMSGRLRIGDTTNHSASHFANAQSILTKNPANIAWAAFAPSVITSGDYAAIFENSSSGIPSAMLAVATSNSAEQGLPRAIVAQSLAKGVDGALGMFCYAESVGGDTLGKTVGIDIRAYDTEDTGGAVGIAISAAAGGLFSSNPDNSVAIKINSGDVLFRELRERAESKTLADDASISLPVGTGMCTVWTADEYMLVFVKSDGSCTQVYGSTNTAVTDSDTDLCVYDAGANAAIKNRLGSSQTVRYSFRYS